MPLSARTKREGVVFKTMIDSKLRSQIIERLLAASDVNITAANIWDTTSFRELDLSSLVLVALATELEHEMGISIDDDELSRIQTVGDLLKTIEGSKSQNRSL